VKIPSDLWRRSRPRRRCCASAGYVTVYSPLKRIGLTSTGLWPGRHHLVSEALATIGVRIAKAMSHHVTVLSYSDRKCAEAKDDLGARRVPHELGHNKSTRWITSVHHADSDRAANELRTRYSPC
jgi:D-arabinose 1-dehydrogenase-like Zn-dependent alcohol dehydrogenase